MLPISRDIDHEPLDKFTTPFSEVSIKPMKIETNISTTQITPKPIFNTQSNINYPHTSNDNKHMEYHPLPILMKNTSQEVLNKSHFEHPGVINKVNSANTQAPVLNTSAPANSFGYHQNNNFNQQLSPNRLSKTQAYEQ